MNKFEKLIELIVNEDKKEAQKLFHEIVVEQSRTIYEGLIDEEDLSEMEEDGDDIKDMVDDVEADEEGFGESIRSVVSVAEAKQLLDYIDGTLNESDAGDLLKKVCEHYEVEMEGLIPALEDDGDELLDIAYGDEEMDGGESDFDMDGEVEMGHEMDHAEGDVEDAELEDRVVDLEDSIDELKQEFDAIIGDEGAEFDDEDGEEDFGGDDEAADDEFAGDDEEEDFEESVVREYVEKVTAPVTNDSEQDSPNTKSTVAGKNDMGGTTANIVKGGPDEKGAGKVSAKTHPGAPYQNDPKAKAGKTSFKKKEKAVTKQDNEKSVLDKPQGK